MEEVARLTAGFSAKLQPVINNSIDSKQLGYLAGLLHDYGKLQSAFQNKLKGIKSDCPHAGAGAKYLLGQQNFNPLLKDILINIIAAHHAGLYDTLAADNKLQNVLSKDYAETSYANSVDYLFLENELTKFNTKGSFFNPALIDKDGAVNFSLTFLSRMLFSMLVDADRLDSEAFNEEGKENNKAEKRKEYKKINELAKKFLNYYQNKFGNLKPDLATKDGLLNSQRSAIYNECLAAADKPIGLFSLTVPTGGGKTLSSMVFALKHAIKYGQERVIYVAPFTAIIDQNANEYAKIFGEEEVLAHYSTNNYQFKNTHEGKEEQINHRAELASENWDAPIIVTTAVQFWESLFSANPQKTRKIHNILNSVVILDECQLLPTQYLIALLETLKELPKYNTSVVLCTATQPALLQSHLPAKIAEKGFGLPEKDVTEIINNPLELAKHFERVTIELKEQITKDKLINELANLNQVLCIVSTRRLARELFEELSKDKTENVYHLSALMCVQHRLEILDKVKECLKNNQPCRLVTTQLIEAGVDIDFPVVYRYKAGLDSLVQAAGRCNRNNKLPQLGKFVIFSLTSDEYKEPLLFQKQTETFEMVKRNFATEEFFAQSTITLYFKKLYSKYSLDEKEVHELCKCSTSFTKSLFETGYRGYNFAGVDKNFKIIDNEQYSLIIPYNNAALELIEDLQKIIAERKLGLDERKPRSISKILKKLAKSQVSVYDNTFSKLNKLGALIPLAINKDSTIYILNKNYYTDCYSSNYGLSEEAEAGKPEDYII
ncbi:MAG: CRISPR-associated helicase Cas3' [Spirochaetaceae bacterium]|nr:CRISPR-associated helicase Cas3' [Spirochaetaceae bacterium]